MLSTSSNVSKLSIRALFPAVCAYGCSDGTCDPAPGNDKCHPQCSRGVATSCNDDGTPKRLDCLFGCDGSSCAPACKPSCENGVATTCNAGGVPEYVDCPEGCDGSACASLECKPSCVDGVATECKADGSSSTRNCPNGCEGNVCAPEIIITGPCKGISCENGLISLFWLSATTICCSSIRSRNR